ncbi:pentatricopeptide repeat-containing protein At1g77170, mitochondrial-like isoform X1 [Cucurbita moschata]|uniref:Pentatricopeptide repeat-containing protein At1g77170, mitochondrial-like isoform X1 n=1 Tax=Cucurbita moschata TaxID=3662 RepID=A0A6J1G132_CUCMO|nr:pentatricopeptide repeat-containing protein At1g77170, mitochondrial-like isoform X1 [Cucurbita moschata]
MHNFKPLRNFLLVSSKNIDYNLLCNSGFTAGPYILPLPSPSCTDSCARRGFYRYAAGKFFGNEYECGIENNKLQNQGLDIHQEAKRHVLPVQDVVSGDKCDGRFVYGDNNKSKFTNVGSSLQTVLMRGGHFPPIYNTKHLATDDFRPLVEFNDVRFIDKLKINKQLAERDARIDAPIRSTYTSDNNVDQVSIVATLLMNCTHLLELSQIHAHILRTNMLENYPSSFSWNNIIRKYTRLEAPRKALSVYIAMLRAGVFPDSYTLPIVFKALSLVYAFGLGLQLHSVAIRLGLEFDQYSESGLISLYSKLGDLECARKVFEQNHHRKLGSWNAIIAGLSQGGRAKEAVDMFIKLRRSGLEPDDVTIVSVTSACGSLGDLELSLQMHKFVFQVKATGKSDILMLNSLIDMYGKCGRMDLALKVFSNMDHRNVSSWTSLIVGYAMHGQVKQALENFRCMREAGVPPNNVTFIGVLSACVHGGMVKEGRHYFEMMKSVYGYKPQLPHYGCMVDLLGKAGLLEEARRMIDEMPMKANSIIWGCLIGACEKHGNVEMGEWAAKHLQELEPWNDGVYVVLSNIYATNGLWKEVQKVREFMKQRQLAKVPGYSLATKLD